MKGTWQAVLVLCLAGPSGVSFAEDRPPDTTWHRPTMTGTAIGVGYGGPLGFAVTGELIHGGLAIDIWGIRL
jgi:hypothetical protein